MPQPTVLGDLRRAVDAGSIPRRDVKQELRDNLIAKLRSGEPLFPGIVGYDESVIPQIVNAILSQHNFIVLGLRGQAKTRILRSLVDLLDDEVAVIPGCEIHDDPLAPLCRHCRTRIDEEGDGLEIGWLPRTDRFVEKLATPDVTIADMIGDIDPIKAARRGLHLSDELTVHYGLVPRANRGIFAVNELPDLAGKIQVGLFNILQEGDVQIKGYPVRLRLDLMMAFTANPDDYTARGKIVSPLKDRIGSEIRTHYPRTRHDAIAITEQEAWVDQRHAPDVPTVSVPPYVKEVVEEIAFQARADQKIDRRSGVSQRLPISCLENVVSNAERRALAAGEAEVVPRVTDVYAALPSITGKFELEYEGELRGADNVARDLIRASVGRVFSGWFDGVDTSAVVEWFEMGGALQVGDMTPATDLLSQISEIQGVEDLTRQAGVTSTDAPAAVASAVDFVLEGLYAAKKISRTEEWQYRAAEEPRRKARPSEPFLDPEMPIPQPSQKKKNYYN